MGLDTRLSLRTIAETREQPMPLSERGDETKRNTAPSLAWHLLGVVFAASAVFFWLEQAPAETHSGSDSPALPDVVVGRWSCHADDDAGDAGATAMRFGPEGSFERRSDDVGALIGDYVAGSEWIDVSLTHLPALERYGLNPSINQQMRLSMTRFSENRLVFDSEILTNGLGSRRWNCVRG